VTESTYYQHDGDRRFENAEEFIGFEGVCKNYTFITHFQLQLINMAFLLKAGVFVNKKFHTVSGIRTANGIKSEIVEGYSQKHLESFEMWCCRRMEKIS
jgi:hypothetical protein